MDGIPKGEGGPQYFIGDLKAQGYRFGLVVSQFNESITKNLLQGATDFLEASGADSDQIHVAWVPGAFEIPLIAKKMAFSKRYDAVICLGAIIRGDTPHFEYISQEVSRGISHTSLESGIPVLFGVLTVETLQQAIERSGMSGKSRKGEQLPNRGQEAASAAIQMINLIKQIQSF